MRGGGRVLGGVGVHVVYVPVNLKVMLSHEKLPQRHNASELSVWVSCGEMRAPLLRRGNHALFFSSVQYTEKWKKQFSLDAY